MAAVLRIICIYLISGIIRRSLEQEEILSTDKYEVPAFIINRLRLVKIFLAPWVHDHGYRSL